MNQTDCLTNYYEGYDEEGRLVSKHGMVEYITTMKYIEKYLEPGMRAFYPMDLFAGRFTILSRNVTSTRKHLLRFQSHGIYLSCIEKKILISSAQNSM